MYVSLCQHCYRHIITGYQWILYSLKLLISRIFKNFHHSQAPPKNLVKAQKFYYKFFREKITVLKILVLENLRLYSTFVYPYTACSSNVEETAQCFDNVGLCIWSHYRSHQ